MAEDMEVSIEVADEESDDLDAAADSTAQLLIEVRDRRSAKSTDAERTAGDG